MPETKITFTERALAKLSGIPRYQLIRWHREGLINPERGKCGRRPESAYVWVQALVVLALGELRRRGVSQRRIRSAAGALPIISVYEHRFLVFDGQLMHARRTDTEVTELLSGLDRGGHVLRIATLAKKLVSG